MKDHSLCYTIIVSSSEHHHFQEWFTVYDGNKNLNPDVVFESLRFLSRVVSTIKFLGLRNCAGINVNAFHLCVKNVYLLDFSSIYVINIKTCKFK